MSTPTQPYRMRVRVTLTVNVDPEAWYATYGSDRAELREDVKSYILNGVQGSAALDEDAIVSVKLVD